MVLIAVVLLAAWAVSILVSRRRALGGHPAAPRWNAGLLSVVLLLSIATCIAPVAPIVAGFGEVADAPPAEKEAVLQGLVGRAWIGFAAGIAAVPLIALGIVQHARNRRRIQEAKKVRDAF